MILTPKEIFEKFCQNDLDKTSLIELLFSIIENSEDDKIRLESIDILNKLKINDKQTLLFMENLLISDSKPEIRKKALKFLFINYQEKVLLPAKWLIKHETFYDCLVLLIKILAKIKNEESKEILKEELRKIKNIKYLNIKRSYENRKYRKAIKRLFKGKVLESLTQSQISEIIINFLTVKHLSEKYPNVFFELNPQTSLIEELDLSDYLEYEVRGTPWDWKNNISSISQINGLNYLKHLKKLNLSNNQIEDINGLRKLKSLTHLFLSNNKIKNLKNLSILNKLPNLEYIDLAGNSIIKDIKNNTFNVKIEVVLKHNFEERFN